jgi:hypothetical protein
LSFLYLKIHGSETPYTDKELKDKEVKDKELKELKDKRLKDELKLQMENCTVNNKRRRITLITNFEHFISQQKVRILQYLLFPRT